MIEQIRECQNCGLRLNQRPLLDTEKECQVFWVGLSAKRVTSDEEGPLSPETYTGMIIRKIEERCKGVSTYKTNLVKCLPLNEKQKLRYPTTHEIDSCVGNLVDEIHAMSPQIVFLLGTKVSSAVGKHLDLSFEKWDGFEYHYQKCNGTYYVPIHHPSYIYVYQRNQMERYIGSVAKMIDQLSAGNR